MSSNAPVTPDAPGNVLTTKTTYARIADAGTILVALLMSAYHLIVAGAVLPPPFVHYPVHVGFALVVLFGRSLALRFDQAHSAARSIGIAWDLVLVVLSVATCGYIAVNFEYVLDRFIWFDPRCGFGD